MGKSIRLLFVFLITSTFVQGQYCTTNLYTSGCTSGDEIDDFTISSYSDLATGCSTGDYKDMTTDTITLPRATTYSYSITTNFTSGEFVGLWIDYNDDQDFDDAGEFLGGSGATSFGSGAPYLGSVYIDNAAALGVHRLRVRLVWNTAVDSSMSCTSQGFGEIHDYSVEITPAPPCPDPFALVWTGGSGTTADLSWSGVTSNQFDIEYGLSGFTPGSGTVVTSTTASVTITGLSPNTAYDAYVTNNCTASGNGTSSSAGPVSFTTNCAVISTFPYIEDFDGPSWVSGAGFDNLGDSIDNCWSRNPGPGANNYFWGARSGGTTSGSTGPNNDLSGTGNYIFTEGSNGSNGSIAYLNLPDFDVTSLTKPWFIYNYHMFGADMGTLSVEVSSDTGQTWTTVSTFTGAQHAAQSDPWIEESADLSSYSSPVLKIRFKGERGNGFQSDMAIDAVSLQEAPTCPKPIGVNILSITDSSVTATWGGVDTVDIEWGPTGFSQGTGTSMTFNNDTVTIHPLAQNGCYDFYIRANCNASGNGTSTWVGPFNFCTSCLTQTIPYIETFDNGFGCFYPIDGGSSNDTWVEAPIGGTANVSGDIDGTPYVLVDSDGAGSGNDLYELLVSPIIDAGSITGDLFIEFDHYFNNISSDSVAVQVFNGTNWINVYSAQSDVGSFATPDHQYLNVTAYANANFQVRFVYDDNNVWAWWWAVDNFAVTEVLCAPSSNLGAYLVTGDSISLNWTPGAGTSYIIEYGTSGFNPGSGQTISTQDTFLTVTGLNSFTTYDFYITDSCGVNALSSQQGPLTVTTPCQTQSLPYLEDFDNGQGCFTVTDGGTSTDTWIHAPAGGTTNTNGDLDGTPHMLVDSDGAGSGPFLFETLTSPPIDASSVTSGGALILEFDQYFNHIGSDEGSVQVFDGNTWNEVLKITSDLGAFSNPDHQFINVTQYANALFQVRFVYDDGNVWAWWWAVDNFEVYSTPCGIASNPDTVWVQPNSANLQWSSTGNMWNVLWGPQGFMQGSATVGNKVSGVTSNPYTLTGLMPSTCYDYFVQDTCSGVGSGPWVGPFTFCTPASCPAPTNLNVAGGSITLNSANINWTAGGSATGYNIQYGPQGFVFGTGTMANSSTTSFSLTNLTPSTTYSVFVRDSCGPGDVSFWTGPLIFSTLCATVSTPFSEDFNANGFVSGSGFDNTGDAINGCWSRNPGSGYFWGTRTGATTSTGTGPSGGVNGSQYMYTEASGSGLGDSAFLNLPVIDLSGLTNPYVKYAYHMYGGDMGNLVLQANTGNGWNTLNTISGQQHTSDTDPWLTDSVDVSAYISAATQFRFVGTSGGGFESDMAIDEIFISAASGCGVPSNVSGQALSCDSIDLSWGSNSGNSIVEYGLSGFTPGSGTVLSAASGSAVLSGLSNNTAYDIYIADICTTDTSLFVGPINITTPDGSPVASFNYTITANPYEVSFDATGSSGNPTSYSWDFGDGNTGSGDSPIHIYANSGTVTVKLVVSNQCGSDSTTMTITNISLAEYDNGPTVSIYPNPATDEVNLEVDFGSRARGDIEIVDMRGSLVYSESFQTDKKLEQVVETDKFSKGIYSITIRTSAVVIRSELVIR